MMMGIIPSYLLTHIPNECIENLSLKNNHEYEKITMLYQKETVLEDNTLYVGYASCLPEVIDQETQYGLIVVNDNQKDLSAFPSDYIELKKDVNINRLYEKLREAWYAYEYKTSFAIYTSLILHNDLNYIIRKTSEILANPVILMDSKANLIAYCADQEIDDPSASHIMRVGYSLPNHIKDGHREGTHKRLAESEMPITVEPGLNKTRRRILGQIMLNKRIYGTIIVIEFNRKFKAIDTKIVNAVCDAISYIIEHQKQATNTLELTDAMSINNIKALLQGEEIAQIWIDNWLKKMGWHIRKSFRVIAIQTKDAALGNELEKQMHCFSIDYEDFILLFINPTNLENFQSEMKILQNTLFKHGCKAGISKEFKDIKDVQTYYRQAKLALQIGERVGKHLINSYSELVLYDMLQSADETLSIRHFYNQDLDKLIEYDTQFGTEYYETFYTFLKCFGDKNRAMSRLFIHRNTMVYRLKRIVEILDIHLSDGEQLFQYYLSCKIKDLIG